MDRRHRTESTSTGKRVRPSPLAERVFLLLQRYRYLPTSHIHAHVGGNKLHLQHLLTDLHHETNTAHGGRYLERPRQRLAFANHFYRPETYENSERAFQHLKDRGLFEPLAHKLTHPGRQAPLREFAHEVMACEIISSIELGARAAGLEFIAEHRILDRSPQATRERMSPFTLVMESLRVTPDRMFGLRYGNGKVRFFALEADRGTMPLTRSGTGSSYAAKLMAYQRVVTTGAHIDQLGIPNLIVLTVTNSSERLTSMLRIAAELGAPNYLAFKSVNEFGHYARTPPSMPELLSEPWTRQGHPALLIGTL